MRSRAGFKSLFLVLKPLLSIAPLCVFGLQLAGHVEQKVLVVDHLELPNVGLRLQVGGGRLRIHGYQKQKAIKLSVPARTAAVPTHHHQMETDHSVLYHVLMIQEIETKKLCRNRDCQGKVCACVRVRACACVCALPS